MQILSHRGYWKYLDEKNTQAAFQRAFTLSFGTETDIRDYQGKLVISHDIANEKCLELSSFFEIYKEYGDLPLALNIKADGLQIKLQELLSKYEIKNYFVFDMSIPEEIVYIRDNFNIFTRESEYESTPLFYEQAKGVWLDEFENHWINESTIQKHLAHNKKICIVSPDLHKREYIPVWHDYKKIITNINSSDVMLCTDFPEEARRFFDVHN